MKDNERELLDIIGSHPDPVQALEVAISLAIDFLKPREEPRDTSSEHPRESA